MDRLDQIKQKFFGLAGRQKVDVFIRSAYRFLNTEELRQLMIDLVRHKRYFDFEWWSDAEVVFSNNDVKHDN